MKRKIVVTKGDIKKGIPSGVRDCPVALAIKRSLRIDTVHVSKEFTCFRFNNAEFDIYLPIKVTKWIDRFDDEKKVEPFAFYLQGDAE